MSIQPSKESYGLAPLTLVHLQARDNGTEPLNSTSIVKIKLLDANDNAPVFERLVYNASAAENSLPGTEVITLKTMNASIVLY